MIVLRLGYLGHDSFFFAGLVLDVLTMCSPTCYCLAKNKNDPSLLAQVGMGDGELTFVYPSLVHFVKFFVLLFQSIEQLNNIKSAIPDSINRDKDSTKGSDYRWLLSPPICSYAVILPAANTRTRIGLNPSRSPPWTQYQGLAFATLQKFRARRFLYLNKLLQNSIEACHLHCS